MGSSPKRADTNNKHTDNGQPRRHARYHDRSTDNAVFDTITVRQDTPLCHCGVTAYNALKNLNDLVLPLGDRLDAPSDSSHGAGEADGKRPDRRFDAS